MIRDMGKKIGLLTWHYYTNYGSLLQTYALLKSIRSLGYDIKVLNYHNPKFGRVSIIKMLIKSITNYIPIGLLKGKLAFLYFPRDRFKRYFNETTVAYTEDDLNKLCENFDTIVCGSDQIWAPNVFNPIYFLNFVPDDKTKISYAASIGLNKIPDHLIKDYKTLISRIKFLSVRESKGKELIQEICGRDAAVVLDPTLLINEKEWSRISYAPKINNAPYIFCYFLKEDHEYKYAVKKYAEKKGLKIIGISSCKDDREFMELIDEHKSGPREFLGFIKNSSVVITDSYHGTIFSLLFHRSFVTFERFKSSETICQNSRINQLVDFFNIKENVVRCEPSTELVIKSVNWEAFEETLKILREKSLVFLKSSLK